MSSTQNIVDRIHDVAIIGCGAAVIDEEGSVASHIKGTLGDGGGQGYARQGIKSLALLASLADCDESWGRDFTKETMVSHIWDEIRHITWDYVGIMRTTKRLEKIRNRVQIVASEIVDYCRKFLVSNNLLELRNLAIVANLKFPVGHRMQKISGHPLHLGLPKNQRQIGPDRPYPGSRDLR